MIASASIHVCIEPGDILRFTFQNIYINTWHLYIWQGMMADAFNCSIRKAKTNKSVRVQG